MRNKDLELVLVAVHFPFVTRAGYSTLMPDEVYHLIVMFLGLGLLTSPS